VIASARLAERLEVHESLASLRPACEAEDGSAVAIDEGHKFANSTEAPANRVDALSHRARAPLFAGVLRATYGLARRQKTVNASEIAQPLCASPAAVRVSMRRLQTAGLRRDATRRDAEVTLVGAGDRVGPCVRSVRTPGTRTWASCAPRAAQRGGAAKKW
jgi:hypothetical protein